MHRRMEEVKRNEQRATVEDLMYASVLEKFVEVGVDMMPTLDSITESQETLKVQADRSSQPFCISVIIVWYKYPMSQKAFRVWDSMPHQQVCQSMGV